MRAELCGDSLIEGTETCDDGNTENGDGCDENCQTETALSAGAIAGITIGALALAAIIGAILYFLLGAGKATGIEHVPDFSESGKEVEVWLFTKY